MKRFVLCGLSVLSACAAPASIPGNEGGVGNFRTYQVYNGEGKTAYTFSADASFCEANTRTEWQEAQCMLDRGNPVIDNLNNFYFPYSKLPYADSPLLRPPSASETNPEQISIPVVHMGPGKTNTEFDYDMKVCGLPYYTRYAAQIAALCQLNAGNIVYFNGEYFYPRSEEPTPSRSPPEEPRTPPREDQSVALPQGQPSVVPPQEEPSVAPSPTGPSLTDTLIEEGVHATKVCLAARLVLGAAFWECVATDVALGVVASVGLEVARQEICSNPTLLDRFSNGKDYIIQFLQCQS
jgi:hypothetical protein